jgi:hypothetical protein
MMNKNRNIIFLLTAAVILFALAIVAESVYFSDYEYHFRTKRFNKILHEKEKVLEDCLNGMKPVLARGEPHGSVSENKVFLMAEENEITLLEYIDNKLFYWSDNGFDVPKVLDDSLFAKPILFLRNGWFLPLTVKEANETVVGLLRIRTDYGFENDIIKSGFEKDFKCRLQWGVMLKMILPNTRFPIIRVCFYSHLHFLKTKAIQYLFFFRLHYGPCYSFWLLLFLSD